MVWGHLLAQVPRALVPFLLGQERGGINPKMRVHHGPLKGLDS